MEERLKELKGNIKEGVGRMTGNKELEAEGRGEKELARAEGRLKGTGEQVKGRIEEGIGKKTGDESMRAEGTSDRTRGDLDRAG